MQDVQTIKEPHGYSFRDGGKERSVRTGMYRIFRKLSNRTFD
jgi:hypothetical protein